MKKLLLTVAIFCISGVFAQLAAQDADESSEPEKKQITLPEKGDIGLGFDAVPFLEYLGNIFNGTHNNSVGAGFPGNSQQVFARYFLDDDVAIRARLRLGQDWIENRNRVILDNQPFPDPDVEVTDQWIDYSTDVRVGGGIELRKGEGRVVGVFGGELSFIYNQDRTEYEYGNPFSESNPAPTTTAGFGGVNGNRFERITEQQRNKQLGGGLNGFVGVEYFIASNISLGAEFTLGIDFIKNYRTQNTYEFWNPNTGSVDTRRTVFEGGNSLIVDTGNYGGSINLMFHF